MSNYPGPWTRNFLAILQKQSKTKSPFLANVATTLLLPTAPLLFNTFYRKIVFCGRHLKKKILIKYINFEHHIRYASCINPPPILFYNIT